MNSRPHIFLDIDGVLSLDFDEYEYSDPKKWNLELDKPRYNIKAVKVFNVICNEINPIIILSSDWKLHFNIDTMNRFFEWTGIEYGITDYTPNLWGVEYIKLCDLEECRAAEIIKYVQDNDITNWVAVDDLNLSPWIEDNFVHCVRTTEGIKQSGINNKIINKLAK